MKCEGACEEHRGDVTRVEVVDPRHLRWDWGLFWYCEEAIEIDKTNGFEVTPFTGTEDTE